MSRSGTTDSPDTAGSVVITPAPAAAHPSSAQIRWSPPYQLWRWDATVEPEPMFDGQPDAKAVLITLHGREQHRAAQARSPQRP